MENLVITDCIASEKVSRFDVSLSFDLGLRGVSGCRGDQSAAVLVLRTPYIGMFPAGLTSSFCGLLDFELLKSNPGTGLPLVVQKALLVPRASQSEGGERV